MKGQISTEVMFVVSIILLLFILTGLFTFQKKSQLDETEIFIHTKNICEKVANAVNYVGINGPGTKARLNIEYFVITRGKKLIIQGIRNTSEEEVENNIAVLLSNEEPTADATVFYNEIDARIQPDWYSNCDIWNPTRDRCITPPQNYPHSLIYPPNGFTQLMQNIDNYQTIIMDDPHINPSDPNFYLNGVLFIRILEDWVDQGNVLILSEHITSYYSIQPIFGQHYGRPLGNPPWPPGLGSYYVEVVSEDQFFPNLSIGDSITFLEPSRITDNVTNIVAGPMNVVAKNVATNEYGISHWRYGIGRIFYLEDFALDEINVNGTSITDDTLATELFENIVIYTIKKAYYTNYVIESNHERACNTEFKIDQDYRVTGNLEIENVNNTITVKNYE